MTHLLAALLLVVTPSARAEKKPAAPQKPATEAPASGPRSLVVLVEEAGLGPEMHRRLALALRAEVERSAQYTSRDPPAISTDELSLSFNCSRLDLPCLQQMGPVLKADSVVLATVGKARAGRELVLLQVNFGGTASVKKSAIKVGDDTTLVAEASKAMRALLGPTRPSILTIVSDPIGAQVDVDGKPAGVTPLSMENLPNGAHQVKISMAGYSAQTAPVELQPGEHRELRISLAAAAPAAPPPPEPVVTAPPPEPVPPAAAPEPRRVGGPLRLGLVGVGGVGSALGAVILVGGLGLMAAAAGILAYAWQAPAAEQRFVTETLPVVYYPVAIGGSAAAVLGVLVVPVAIGVIVAGVVLGAVL